MGDETEHEPFARTHSVRVTDLDVGADTDAGMCGDGSFTLGRRWVRQVERGQGFQPTGNGFRYRRTARPTAHLPVVSVVQNLGEGAWRPVKKTQDVVHPIRRHGQTVVELGHGVTPAAASAA